MRTQIRQSLDKMFTAFAGSVVLLIAGVLLVVLVPMFRKGLSAVFFTETVEFRKLQMDLHDRGDERTLKQELERVAAARKPIYDILLAFSRGLDMEPRVKEVKNIYQQYGEYLNYRNTPKEQYTECRKQAKEIRDTILDALESMDKQVVLANLDKALAQKGNPTFKDTPVQHFFTVAEQYRKTAQTVDLTKRSEYLAGLRDVTAAIRQLFGPLPGEDEPPLPMDQYGATRMDMARKALHTLLWDEQWIADGPGKPLVKKIIARKTQFTGTELEPLFDRVEKNFNALLLPRHRFYWQYFIDDWVNSHYFGGIGPEILGTLLLTVLSMLFAVPFGVVSAAYLVEYASDNIWIKIIRICINTLAGVPSIVYGLFGLAFFVITISAIGKPCILAASLTLSILVLPVIIRASEEAIRAVPQTYREASLALGAGKFRTLVKVILPAAGPGILTGIILSLSRAAGETAPILFTGVVAMGPIPNFGTPAEWVRNPASIFGGLFQPTRALSYGSYDIAVGDRISMLVPHQQFGMVMTLILLILVLNVTAIVIRSRLSKKLRGH
ncbi:MAG: phosphate ABC transporter permease PstA [Planctomycetes bacterium]|nr:phosphate ABC transporter permease PstA [Planctomycetota bacterium]